MEVNISMKEADKLIKECKMSENRRKHIGIIEKNKMDCFIHFPEDIEPYYRKIYYVH